MKISYSRAETLYGGRPDKVRPPHTNKDLLEPSEERYFAAAPGVSFGGTPMTLTPEPRDTSIACTTWPYFTFGSPFTKMIFSGRPS